MNAIERRRRRAAIDAAMAFVILLLIVQMWLLTATLESYLAGHRGVAGVAFAASGCLFLSCVGLYLLVTRLDRDRETDDTRRASAGPWEIGDANH